MKFKMACNQFGFTLIELMVSMTLGLFLMTGVIQLFLASSQTYSVVASQSQVQDTGRFSLFFLSRGIRQAGYWSTIDLEEKKTFVAHKLFPVDNAIVFGRDNDLAVGGDGAVLDGSDDIYVRMAGSADGDIKTCMGQAITETEVAIDHYYVGVTTGTESIPSLYCSSSVYFLDTDAPILAITDPLSGAPTAVIRPLLNGIEAMQILYGVGTQNEVTQYLDAATIADWRDVRSIKVALLSTSNDDTEGAQNSQSYALLDETFTTSGDSRPRMVFQQTISLRNFIPN